ERTQNWHTPTWSRNFRLWAKDVYVDTAWARCQLGDAPHYHSCRHLEMVIPVAWSNSLVDVVVHTGSFSQGTRVWLFVISEQGVPCDPGFPLQVGSVYGR